MSVEFKTGDHVLGRKNNIPGIVVAEEKAGVFLIKPDSGSRDSFSAEKNDLVLLKAGNEYEDRLFNLNIRKLNRYLKKNYKPPVIEPESKNAFGKKASHLESSSSDKSGIAGRNIAVKKPNQNTHEESTEKHTTSAKSEEPEHDRKHRSVFAVLTSFFRKLAFWNKSDEEDDNAEPDVSEEAAEQHVPELLFYQNVSFDDHTTVLQDPGSSEAEQSEIDFLSRPGVFGGTAHSLLDDVPETTEVRPSDHAVSDSAADAISETVLEAPASLYDKPSPCPAPKPSMPGASEHHSFEAPVSGHPRPSAHSDRESHSFEAPTVPNSRPASHSARKPVIYGAPKAQRANYRRYDSVGIGTPLKGLERFLENRQETFQEMLFRLIDDSGKTDSEIYTKANIDRRYFSKIRSGNIPKRSTVMALCLALHLDSDVAADLMNKAGYGFSDANITDLIVVFCLQERIFDLDTVNDILHRYKEDYLRV